jgi:hypothetical protein
LDPDCELRDHRSAAVGQRRRHAASATWHAWRYVGPLLLGLYGVGLIGAAMFTADPGMGFPPGAPEQTIISTRGLMHLAVGSIGFLGFVVTCFVFARRFGELAQPQWKGFSLITGVLFLAAFLGIASGSKGRVGFPFALAVVLGFTWISMLMLD